ncbi:GDSL esterase/lipase At4g10955-like isoform X1 [Lycium ferocissimum]|uniref:GDSL esterase/lipase At4g10955-like isoform X1 n=1 Tax=Lycium ferocissimum TaxID=112874 RepID=UPI002815E0FB|nr:GDSL esterase/lipase At4g10955-like isoform X1 [Lycium ferocissimum]
MAKRGSDEMKNELMGAEGEIKMENLKEGVVESHPYAFHVSGPRNVASPNWRDLINSSWKDANYKRTVMACFVQVVYLLEIDRQENRTEENALAPKWLIPFKYKLVETLNDERDGSIFGAILEWDRSAALSDFVLIRPSGAPRAVVALRGTLLKSQTMRRDIEDDLRFLAWESLKGSVRFSAALSALKSIATKYGSNSVCIVGHSLGAGFALQVGKSLAKEGVHVEAHLFNPPSVSLAMSLRNIGEKAGLAWKRLKTMLPSKTDDQMSYEENAPPFRIGLKQWVPHLYINNSDYICCSYTDQENNGVQDNNEADKENAKPRNNGQQVAAGAKLFLSSNKGKQKFLEAHGLEQWWSDNLELQMAISNSKLISQQLKSLYTLPASQLTQVKRQ